MKGSLLSPLIGVHLRQKFIISQLLCDLCDPLAIGLEFASDPSAFHRQGTSSIDSLTH
jgi:hypothetical protein